MRFAVDTGGTFTDLVVQGDDGSLALFKAPTTPDDPVRGVIDVLRRAATHLGETLDELLRGGELIFATTRAINAVLTETTARTGFIATRGHEDILVLRQGGRSEPFDFTVAYPEPYIRRRLTFGVAERVDFAGAVVEPLDEDDARHALSELRRAEVEAIAVCLLWSIANSAHELRVGELIEEELPGVPYTLSHKLNPILGEYERASSAAIDASLKPLMSEHLERLEHELRAAGLTGSVLVVTSSGGLLPAAEVAAAPIHSLNSGPSMAPLAGRHSAAEAPTAIVADTGGTSYDLSVIRDGVIARTRETWLGQPYRGHLTGLPSIDVRSIGAGGGSIAWVDEAGLLRVGPRSAGAVPGPACYGRGGTEPTVTDAVVVLGYLAPETFLDGEMEIDRDAAQEAIDSRVGSVLGLASREAAAAILALATEHMVQAIDAVTVRQGVDPQSAVLVAGGGAAGLNSVAIGRRLACRRVIFPESGAALSATGALLAGLTRDVVRTVRMATDRLDVEAANRLLDELEREARRSMAGYGVDDPVVEAWVEARYPNQSWDLELALACARFRSAADVKQLDDDFHALHERVFAIRDSSSPVELTAWRVRASMPQQRTIGSLAAEEESERAGVRRIWFADGTERTVPVARLSAMIAGDWLEGPAIVEAPSSSIVIDPGARARRNAAGHLEVIPDDSGAGPQMSARAQEADEGVIRD